MSLGQFRCCVNVDEACAAFNLHGFCIIQSGLSDHVLDAWDNYLQLRVPELETGSPSAHAFRAPNRFSLNVLGYSLADNPYYSEFRSIGTLHDIIASIYNCKQNPLNDWMEGSYFVKGNGGDVCKAGEPCFQHLHSDWAQYPLCDTMYGIPLVASIALSDINENFAPIRIVSKQQVIDSPLPVDDQGSIWGQEYFACLRKGDILLRDCRIPHSGTPNGTGSNRCLPGIQILSPEWCSYRWGSHS